jgi:hypothetical protein
MSVSRILETETLADRSAHHGNFSDSDCRLQRVFWPHCNAYSGIGLPPDDPSRCSYKWNDFMNPAQYWLTISMIIAAQAPLRQLHAAPVQADTSECGSIQRPA